MLAAPGVGEVVAEGLAVAAADAEANGLVVADIVEVVVGPYRPEVEVDDAVAMTDGDKEIVGLTEALGLTKAVVDGKAVEAADALAVGVAEAGRI